MTQPNVQPLLDCIDDYAEQRARVRAAPENSQELSYALTAAASSWTQLMNTRHGFSESSTHEQK